MRMKFTIACRAGVAEAIDAMIARDYTKMMRDQNFPAIVSDTDYLANAFQHVITNYTVIQSAAQFALVHSIQLT